LLSNGGIFENSTCKLLKKCLILISVPFYNRLNAFKDGKVLKTGGNVKRVSSAMFYLTGLVISGVGSTYMNYGDIFEVCMRTFIFG